MFVYKGSLNLIELLSSTVDGHSILLRRKTFYEELDMNMQRLRAEY